MPELYVFVIKLGYNNPTVSVEGIRHQDKGFNLAYFIFNQGG